MNPNQTPPQGRGNRNAAAAAPRWWRRPPAILFVAIGVATLAFVLPGYLRRPIRSAPNFSPANQRQIEEAATMQPHRITCINHLRQLRQAKQQWAAAFWHDGDAPPTGWDLVPYLGNCLNCPRGGTYTLGQVWELPTCTISGHKLPPDE